MSATLPLAELLHRLGNVPADRIRLVPPPGTATLQDAIDAKRCELIENTLVEKAMGLRESLLAGFFIEVLRQFVIPRQLGVVTSPDGMMQIASNLVRIPDIAFISWDRFPDGRVPLEPVPLLAPDLAIEILSRGNTPKEMAIKRRDYFAAGVRQIWIVDEIHRSVTVYTSETTCQVLTEADSIHPGEMLPGFTLPVRNIFADLDFQRQS